MKITTTDCTPKQRGARSAAPKVLYVVVSFDTTSSTDDSDEDRTIVHLHENISSAEADFNNPGSGGWVGVSITKMKIE